MQRTADWYRAKSREYAQRPLASDPQFSARFKGKFPKEPVFKEIDDHTVPERLNDGLIFLYEAETGEEFEGGI